MLPTRAFCCHGLLVLALFLSLLALGPRLCPAGSGQLEIKVTDRETGKPIPCRMHLKNLAGRPKFPSKGCFWDDHFIVPGKISLKLPTGAYTFEMERGPEYTVRSGQFVINNYADDAKDVDMHRFVDMSADGWWSGDLDVHRAPRDIETLMAAEDLHVASLVTWWNGHSEWAKLGRPQETLLRTDHDRYCQVMGGEQDRPGGRLLYLNLPAPLDLGDADAEFPPTARYLQQVRKYPGAWVDLSKPYWWDLPMLVALGQVDSIQVAHSNFCRKRVINEETGGKPRDAQLYAGKVTGNALWSQYVYFQLLNCGLRIPPSAGSGSGVTPNPVGYNRAYVHVEGDFTYQKWFEGLRAGRVTITNGPLMRPSVQGELPGHVFHGDNGSTLEFEIGLTLSVREPITYMEIIKDGKVEHEIRFAQYAASGKLPKLKFDRSGWFLVRAVTDLPNTYRFAMTGPYYVEIGYGQRISKRSVQFFVDWVMERARQIHLADAGERREVLAVHRQARDFWQSLLMRANAE